MPQTPPQIAELIANSGNNFHAKVARWFEQNGWHTIISPYYMDQSQAKARELDLVVEKLWPITDSVRQREGYVMVRLYVECKFIPNESVFWFAPKNTKAAADMVCRLGPYRADNMYTNKHHYIATSAKVAKLFASSNNRSAENDPFFKAVNQSLNALVAMRGQPPAHPELQGRKYGTLVTLEYPLVVCSSFSQMYGVDFLQESEPTPVTQNFQMEVQYAYLDRAGSDRNEYFLIDFVEFNQLSAFESALAEGVQAGAYLAARG